jgi:hypothetical protein
MVEPRMHAEAVVFDFVEPLLAFRRGIDELGQLRPDPVWQKRADRCVSGELPIAPCRERGRVGAAEHGPLYASLSRGGPLSP